MRSEYLGTVASGAEPGEVLEAVVQRLVFEGQHKPTAELARAVAYLQRAQAELMMLDAKRLESDGAAQP